MDIYACDNDCFGTRDDRGWWEREGETAWLHMLDRIPNDPAPMFCLLPDVVADWSATIAKGHRYRDELASRGLSIALALQDGCDFDEAVSLSPDWVFVGGSTEWKVRNIGPTCRFFHPLGIRVHVGRVNGTTRLLTCLNAGVDSVDGTGWARFTKRSMDILDPTIQRWTLQARFDLSEATG